ncbi:MAG: hypothetical protein QOC91_437 [Solirubrobacteraceae bacterium]|nr:hypothetical protein [Solirubrobacteraceae bacterium]
MDSSEWLPRKLPTLRGQIEDRHPPQVGPACSDRCHRSDARRSLGRSVRRRGSPLQPPRGPSGLVRVVPAAAPDRGPGDGDIHFEGERQPRHELCLGLFRQRAVRSLQGGGPSRVGRLCHAGVSRGEAPGHRGRWSFERRRREDHDDRAAGERRGSVPLSDREHPGHRFPASSQDQAASRQGAGRSTHRGHLRPRALSRQGGKTHRAREGRSRDLGAVSTV